MIALRHGIPLISLPNGRSVSFSKQWIISALQQAAERVGLEHWSTAYPLADAMALYLQREFEENVIQLSHLERAIHNLLLSFKHHDIAACFSLPDPPVYLSLVDLVHEAGTGYELAFFQLLRKQLQATTQSTSLRLKISDLDSCLRLLTHRHRLGRNDVLREEIINYVRRYGHSHFFCTTRSNKQPLEIELS